MVELQVWKGGGWGAIHGWSNEEGGIKNWDREISTIRGYKLQQKLRNLWFVEGDYNRQFFYLLANWQKNANLINNIFW